MEIKLNEYWKLVGSFPEDMDGEEFLAMIEAVRNVVRKNTYMGSPIKRAPKQAWGQYAERRTKIMELTKAGKTPHQIAAELNITNQMVYDGKSKLRREGRL